jgi:energy-coupling factor transporter ATP-binding protein EcfA2
MKITVRNLGAIKEAEFDLKPLTILIGPNNAGKTWLAYTLAGIFGSYGFTKYFDAYIEENLQEYPSLDQAIEGLDTGTRAIATINLLQFVDEYGEKYFNRIAEMMKHCLCEFMSSRFASFEEMGLSVYLKGDKNRLSTQMKNYTVSSVVPTFADQRQSLLRILKTRGSADLRVYTYAEAATYDELVEEKAVEQVPLEVIKERVVLSIFQALHRSLYSHVRVFPTERTTFITLPFSSREEADRKPLEKVPQLMHEVALREHPSRRVIGPVSSFLSMISSIYKLDSTDLALREETAQKNPKIKEYVRLADLLETEILGGKMDLSPAGSGLSREILFRPAQGDTLEIPIASSMVKELAPLVLYLRYLARPGELLIIDEPEMNLHPEAQVKIIEFLAILVNAGLHVLITTHSPYMVDHLLNLRKASEHTNQETICDKFFLRTRDAFISQRKSVVYLIDQGKIKNMLDEPLEEDKQEEEEDTFGKISDRLSEIYFAL